MLKHKQAPDLQLLQQHYDFNPNTGLFYHKRNTARGKIGTVAGCRRRDGYIVMSVGSKSYLAHQIMWFLVHGTWVPQLDHKNRNPSDNRIGNLRPATHGQNTANSTGQSRNGRKYDLPRGVYPNKRYGKPFLAQITVYKQQIYLGYFDTPEEASRAYQEAAQSYFKEFAP